MLEGIHGRSTLARSLGSGSIIPMGLFVRTLRLKDPKWSVHNLWGNGATQFASERRTRRCSPGTKDFDYSRIKSNPVVATSFGNAIGQVAAPKTGPEWRYCYILNFAPVG